MKIRFKRKQHHKLLRNRKLTLGKEMIPASERGKPVFSASDLKMTSPRTAEETRRAMREGRFAEMTPDLAGL